MRKFVTLATVLSLAAAPVLAKPALRDVAEIDNGLMAIAIADEIRKTCDDIDARMIRALAYLSQLKSKARSLGYSDDEIDDYVTSKAEKARMRTKAESYLSARGVVPSDTASLCAFGKAEIDRGSVIGQFLR